jgi:hypothetical protein
MLPTEVKDSHFRLGNGPRQRYGMVQLGVAMLKPTFLGAVFAALFGCAIARADTTATAGLPPLVLPPGVPPGSGGLDVQFPEGWRKDRDGRGASVQGTSSTGDMCKARISPGIEENLSQQEIDRKYAEVPTETRVVRNMVSRELPRGTGFTAVETVRVHARQLIRFEARRIGVSVLGAIAISPRRVYKLICSFPNNSTSLADSGPGAGERDVFRTIVDTFQWEDPYYVPPAPGTGQSVDNRSCKEWADDRRSGNATADQLLVLGFIGYYQTEVGVPAVGLNSDGIYHWTDNYCAGHPTVLLRDAAVEFLQEIKGAQRKP